MDQLYSNKKNDSSRTCRGTSPSCDILVLSLDTSPLRRHATHTTCHVFFQHKPNIHALNTSHTHKRPQSHAAFK